MNFLPINPLPSDGITVASGALLQIATLKPMRRRYNAAMSTLRKPPRDDAESTNVRHVDGVGWQVLMERSSQWHTCRNEQDACFIASGMLTVKAVNRGQLTGLEVADELTAVAAVAAHCLGQVDAEQFVQAAERARRGAAN